MTDARRSLLASAPTRLDFGGGWTDVPPFSEERGGRVCNIAISRRATVRLTAVSASDAPKSSAPHATDRLIRAALERAQTHDVRVSIESDFPVGAGLGGSSAAGVALAAALHVFHDWSYTPASLAEWSRAVEVDGMHIAGGRQDHYAAAFGGALDLTFASDTQAVPISISPAARSALESRVLLAYTGESRMSATTITSVLEAYRERVPRVVDALDTIARLAHDMCGALREGDIDALAHLVDEQWHAQRLLHPAITTARIEAIEHAARGAGAHSLKALGASGGGCVMVFAPFDAVDTVTAAIAPLSTLLPWRIDDIGVVVRAVDDVA